MTTSHISGQKYPKMIEGTFQLKQFPSVKSKIPTVGYNAIVVYSSAYITRQYPYNNLPMVFSANMVNLKLVDFNCHASRWNYILELGIP